MTTYSATQKFLGRLPKSLLISGLLAASAAIGQSAAAHDYVVVSGPDPIDGEFRASHPFRVFVDVSKRQTPRGRRADAQDHFVRDQLHNRLPGNIVLVSNPRNADMTVRAELNDYDLTFHTVDVDRRNKKYDKKYRYAPGRCGQFKRAFYTRVTRKGVALANYQLSFRLKGEGMFTDAVQIRASESYRYGQDLSSLTNCGVAPSAHYPNKTVARLFTQAGGHYQDLVAREIHRESLENLARFLADNIAARSEQFYVALAASHTGPTHGYGRGHRKTDATIYDFDDFDRTQPRHRPRERDWRD